MASSDIESDKPSAPPTRSVLHEFLALRNVPVSAVSPQATRAVPSAANGRNVAAAAAAQSPPMRSAAAGATSSKATSASTANAAPLPVWRYFRKCVHGERVAALRAAMRAPDDIDADSRDAYNPTKLPKRFVHLHTDETRVSIDFCVHTRAMFFEREQVDRDVCDRLENRAVYDAQLTAIQRHYTHDDSEDADP